MFENRLDLPNKNFMTKIILNIVFLHFEIDERELTISPKKKKSKLIIFHLKCMKQNQNCLVYKTESLTFKIISQIC